MIDAKTLRIGIVLGALLMLGVATGCTQFREATRPLSLAIAVTYTGAGSDVVVRYSVPPPPPGKVYILWVYSRGQAQISKLGVINPGVERVVKGSAPFPIQGVNITLEDGPEVTKMGERGIVGQVISDENLGPTAGGANGGGRSP